MQTFYNRIKPGRCSWTFSVMLVMLTLSTAWAQRITVTGTITDAQDGSPLIGAAVVIKSTTQGTITNVDGTFTLESEPNDVLVISSSAPTRNAFKELIPWLGVSLRP